LDAIAYDSERALALQPKSAESLRLWAQALALRWGPAEADRLLKQKCQALAAPTNCLELRLEYGFQASPASARAAAEDMLSSVCAEGRAKCASTADTLRKLAVERGLDNLAVTYARRAAEEEPTTVRWVAAAEAALRTGRTSLALDAVRKAKGGGAAAPALNERIRLVERQALSEAHAP